jgi:hypothetical protein
LTYASEILVKNKSPYAKVLKYKIPTWVGFSCSGTVR